MELDGSLIFLIVVAVIVVGLILLSARVVPQGFEYTVERFGRWRVTLSPGLHFIVPAVRST